ncbi:MAG: dihydroxyacetone kinase family protein, partial [Isosphaeraceae bacterium]|nr:dihydroxyacetone kinase family protein [Isosphaeraceae bacterium]
MKKLINRPDRVVEEMVQGLVALDPGLRRLPGRTVVVRADAEAVRGRQVALISGGGSGHEPAHAGYVGRGMLSAAVAGDVFTSPSPDAVLAAIRAVAGTPGALLIVKNYTGDRLNFGLAAERARAEGLNVETAIVADDVALARSTDNAGRRGIAGTVFVHKVAGAAAEAGASLADVAAEARAAAEAVRTMGVALTPCTVPAAGRPGFTLGDGDVELGLGIHGEPGVRRAPLEPADALVDHLLGAILADARHQPGDRVALLINNLGSTPPMELAIVARHALSALAALGIVVERAYAGTFLSALEMAGVSLSVLPLDDRRLARLDAVTDAPAWRAARGRPRAPEESSLPDAERPPAASEPPRTPAGLQLREALRAVAVALENEHLPALDDPAHSLTDLDSLVGDGDINITLNRGARALDEAIASYPLDDPANTLDAVGLSLERAMGGTSGALYGVFFLRAADALRSGPPDDPRTWAAAFDAGCAGITALGGAEPG